METRFLGHSGFKVPALGFGAGTFGGKGPLFSAWGDSDAAQARRLLDICLDAGVNLFDTADVYSDGASEDILGAAIHELGHSLGLTHSDVQGSNLYWIFRRFAGPGTGELHPDDLAAMDPLVLMRNLDHVRMTSRRLSYILQQQVHLYTPEANKVRAEIDQYVEAERQIEWEMARRGLRNE